MRSISAALITSALALAACSRTTDTTVFQTTANHSDLSTFRSAIQFASVNNDLVDLMSTRGTLTVFAPDNRAFDDLAVELTGNPNAVGTDLLTDANRAFLHGVLQYHLLTFTMRADEIPYGQPIPTLEGDILKIEQPGTITDGRNRTATIIQPDIEATNGVTHVIDRVLLPPNLTIGQTIAAQAASGEFTILLQVVAAANLSNNLEGHNTFTLFAPTDAAFQALLTEKAITLPELLANPSLIVQIVEYHIVPGRLLIAQIPAGKPITTLEGGTFQIDEHGNLVDGRGRFGHFVQTDIMASNGVIHVIDFVMLPR